MCFVSVHWQRYLGRCVALWYDAVFERDFAYGFVMGFH